MAYGIKVGGVGSIFPLAPDNPRHDFNHRSILIKAVKYCCEMNKVFPDREPWEVFEKEYSNG